MLAIGRGRMSEPELAIAQRAYIIENGHVAMKGKAADMLKDPALRKNYLGL